MDRSISSRDCDFDFDGDGDAAAACCNDNAKIFCSTSETLLARPRLLSAEAPPRSRARSRDAAVERASPDGRRFRICWMPRMLPTTDVVASSAAGVWESELVVASESESSGLTGRSVDMSITSKSGSTFHSSSW